MYIPKPGTTEKRPLGIPTAKDRVKQMVLKIIMEPLEERKAEKESYGFREGIGCAEAIREAQEALEMGKY